MRTIRAVALCLLLAAPAWGRPARTVPLDVSGDGVVVVTLVRSLPCKVTAAPGAAVYLWSVPDGLTATSDEHVLTVSAGAKGQYRVSVVGLWIDFDKKQVRKERGEVTLNVGDAPPGPGPRPPDPPGPAPAGPLRVLIVVETADIQKNETTMPGHYQIVYGMPFRASLRAITDKDGPDKRGWNIWDKDQDVSGAAKFWQDAMKRPRPSVPYLHVYNGDAVSYEGRLPATPAEALALIGKYAPKTGGK